MTSINFKTIDFSNGSLENRDAIVNSDCKVKSAKSVAYVVRWQLASRRSGSAKVKAMSEISGTTAKPYKQKGTGNARQGSKRSVQFVGGRTCHGPTPRSFDFSMPKKIVKVALLDVINSKLSDGKFYTFSNFGSEIKTSKVKTALEKNNLTSALIIYSDSDSLIAKSAKNLKNVKPLNSKAINVYDMLRFDSIIVSEDVFEKQILGVLA